MASTIGLDPLSSYCFFIEITGIAVAQFQKVEGLSVEIKTIEHRENKLSGLPVLKKLPGHVTYADIQLSRGKVADQDFWDWIKDVQEGKIDKARKDGSVVLFDYELGPVQRFNFFAGWPSKVSIGALQAGGNEVLLENVTITHERLEIVK